MAIMMIGLFVTACSGSRGCGCPSWGSVQPADDVTLTVEHTTDNGCVEL